ncbi:SH3 domain-containing protein [Azospirillum fermentarium]|uniref:SH3 domain-containing protein n=1 Tax=Azospirillum fermentarium TaxID=1233114 RepID=UPI0022263FA3|nr:SH3 domain-containing protein [Azospirillum fermentarium]
MTGGRLIAAFILLAGLPGAGLAQTAGKPATPVSPPTPVAPKITPAVQPKDAPALAPRGPWLPLPVLPKPLSPPVLAGSTAPVAAPVAVPVPPPAPPVAEQPPPPVSPAPPAAGPGGDAIAAGRAVWATAGIYIRAEPSANGLVLDTLEKGQRATALTAPDSAGWVRIARGGKPAGWVAGAYLAEHDPDSGTAPQPSDAKAPDAKTPDAKTPDAKTLDTKAASCLGPSPAPARVAAPGTKMRITTDTRIRREPSCDSPAIDVIDGGAVVTVTGGGDDGWYRIRGAGWDGVYVAAKLLAPLRR